MSANDIHPTAIVGDDVEMGSNNRIGPYCVLEGPLRIGDGNMIGPHVCIGTPGQEIWQRDHDSSGKRIEIGNDNIIREFTAIQKPVYGDVTRLGSNIFLMQSVHVPHDAQLDDRVVCTPNTVMAGVSRILEGGYLAMGASVHQYSVIGHYSIVATNAAATKNVRPFTRYIPGRPVSLNSFAIERYGFEDHRDEITAYVEDGARPESEWFGAIVAEYEELHEKSGRKQY